MSIFSTDDSKSPLTVDVGEFDVYTAAVENGDDPTVDPTWDGWKIRPELKFLGAFYGSSIAGMSYAKIKLAPGAPEFTNDDVEEYSNLNIGDRVCIVQSGTGSDNILFAGYCLGGRIEISGSAEALHFRIVGPEWIWGDHEVGGAWKPISGQVRRTADADDAWVADPTHINSISTQLYRFTNDRCVFNPGGRKNMTLDDVYLDDDSTQLGRCWDTPERLVSGTLRTASWTVLQACKTLELWFNEPKTSGIANPDWSKAGIDSTQTLPQTDVEGMGLWGAMKKACGPEYGFFVDPRGSSDWEPAGTQWGPFNISFFTRGQGPAVSVYLNERGTSITNARASVARLEAQKSIEKTVTKATVLCRLVRHIKLQYRGDQTPAAASAASQKNLLLQHGWTASDLSLGTYVGSGIYNTTIDARSIDASGSTNSDLWRDQYTTRGKYFAKFQHAGRLFVWNESAEYAGTPTYGASSTKAYFAPSLTGIADGENADVGKLCRKRRRIIETPYYDTSIDQWRRVRPLLFLKAVKPGTENSGTWTRVPTAHWRLDPERASIWITAPDIAEWYPLGDDQDPVEPSINDNRSFATLLYSGDLRMTLEGSIEADCCIKQTADRQAVAGSPFVREISIRADHEYVKSEVFADGVDSQTGLTAATVDNTADAMTVATQYRNSGQDQMTHASILCSADWPLQPIGGILTTIQGRSVSMTGGPSGRGAQIVAVHLDPESMKWEMLTESTALKLRRMDRIRVNRKRQGIARQTQANNVGRSAGEEISGARQAVAGVEA